MHILTRPLTQRPSEPNAQRYRSVSVWSLVGITVVLLVTGAVVAFLSRSGTLYFFSKYGFIGSSFVCKWQPHHASESTLAVALERLLPGDVFDTLCVPSADDEYSGVVVSMESGTPVLGIQFKTHSEIAKLDLFKKAMDAGGFTGAESLEGYNGGFGEKFRVTYVEYGLPPSAARQRSPGASWQFRVFETYFATPHAWQRISGMFVPANTAIL